MVQKKTEAEQELNAFEPYAWKEDDREHWVGRADVLNELITFIEQGAQQEPTAQSESQPDPWAYAVGRRLYEHMRLTPVLAPVYEMFEWRELPGETQKVFAEMAVLAQ